jgi:hypothetical protein
VKSLVFNRLPVFNRLIIGVALFLLVCIGGLLYLSRPGEARGSALARGPGGWLAARKYLEARGVRVKLLDRPLNGFREGGVLVVAFPWQSGIPAEAGDPLEEHLRRGGDLVLAYSGEASNPGELVALEGLGLPLQEVRKVVLNPVRWRRFAREEWDLQPAKGTVGVGQVRVWAPRWAPEIPKEAQVLLRSPKGPAVVMLPRYRGRIWILPADAFANACAGVWGTGGRSTSIITASPAGGRSSRPRWGGPWTSSSCTWPSSTWWPCSRSRAGSGRRGASHPW